jgi:two-component system, response regulator
MSIQYYPLIVVDDDEDDRFLFEEFFAQAGWKGQALMLESGDSLLANLATIPHQFLPSVLLLDYNMPKCNGEEVFRELKKYTAYDDIKVVFYSSGMDASLQKKLLDMGATGCLSKPGSTNEFLRLAEYLHQLMQPVEMNMRLSA